MHQKLDLEVIPKDQLSEADYAAILTLCSQAFEEDYGPYMETFSDSVHVLARQNGVLASHALWVTRWLQVGDDPLLHTAYVEGVATAGSYREQGFATAVMERLAEEITAFDIGALSPAGTTLYTRLGWEFWQGSLFHRKGGEVIPDPDEVCMILRLPKTPDLDLTLPLSVEWREGEIW
jgi:aminoglycoside 2'-N-acetyltransferase I